MPGSLALLAVDHTEVNLNACWNNSQGFGEGNIENMSDPLVTIMLLFGVCVCVLMSF